MNDKNKNNNNSSSNASNRTNLNKETINKQRVFNYNTPENILFDRDLNATDIRVYALIRSFADTHSECYASNDWLCDKVSVGIRAIQNSISLLENKGYIERVFINNQRYLGIKVTRVRVDEPPKEEDTPPCSNGSPPHALTDHPPHDPVDHHIYTKVTNQRITTTDEEIVVVFSSKGQDENIKKKLADIPEVNKPKISLITWLKQIKFHIEKYFPNNFNHGLNAVLKLCRQSPWGTPPGFIDTDEQIRLKAESDAIALERLKLQDELHAKRTQQAIKPVERKQLPVKASLILQDLCKSIGARSTAPCYG